MRKLNYWIKMYLKKDRSEANSILLTISTIHATILSIILATAVVFFFYSYPIIDNLKEELNNLRIKVAQTMVHQLYFPIEHSEEYFKDNNLDIRKIENEFWDVSSAMRSIEITRKAPPNPRMSEDYIEKEIIKSAEHLLQTITVITYIYPYCERPKDVNGHLYGLSNIIGIKYTPQWEHDLVRLNFSLFSLWKTKSSGFTKLISEYDAISAKKDSLRLNYSQYVVDFFNQVQFVETQIVPELREKSYKLNLYENRFKIKRKLIEVLLLTITILIAGVLLPLYLCIKHLYSKKIELTLLIITFLPYVYILIYYIGKSFQL